MRNTTIQVEQEKLAAQIDLERQRTTLVETQTANKKLLAEADGQSEGARLAHSSLAFLRTLNSTIPEPDIRLSLLRFYHEQQTLTKQTENLATGKASLFLTPQDVNLKLQMPSHD